MKEHRYYPEEELIQKLESKEYGWLDYVDHFSEEWQEEYILFCKEQGYEINDLSAREFVQYKDMQLEQALMVGEA